jgi:hypothetical protein
MALANLTDLQTSIGVWLARTDISTAQINDFITLAETDMEVGTYNGDGMELTPPLRVRSMEVRTAAFPLTGEYTTLPTGFLEMREVFLSSSNPQRPLEYVSPATFDATYLSATTWANVWTIVGNAIRVGPGAGPGDTLGIVYYEEIPGLVASSTNWMLTKYPNAYLYGALRHAAPWIGDGQFIDAWQTGFVSAIRGLIRSERQSMWSGPSMVSRPIGVTVT